MREHGGPEVLEVLEVERPKHYPVEVLIRTKDSPPSRT